MKRNGTEPNSGLPHVVIVGGGFGGLQAALALRNAPVHITILDRTNYHLFQPLLYQVATAGLSPADISAPIRHIVRNQRNTTVLMAEVTGVDAANRRVLLHSRTIPYDYLILATGATHSYFGHEEWGKDAPGLKTIPNATSIRAHILQAFEMAEQESDPERLKELLTFVLVGAGPTGVEMAGAIAELARTTLASEFRHIDPASARILLLEAGKRILNAFPEDLAHQAQRHLEKLGVEIRTDSHVDQIDENGVLVAGQHIASRTVLWTAGVKASPAGKWLNAPTDRAGRVNVAPDLTVPGHPEIFVIGDTATLQQNGKPLPGVAPVAMQQGRYAASVIRNRVETKPVPPPFHYVNKGNLATVGRAFAILEVGRFKMSGFLAWVGWLVIHIFYLIGFRNRLLVMLQWAWAYFTYQRGVRLITEEENAKSDLAPSHQQPLASPAETAPPAELSETRKQPTPV